MSAPPAPLLAVRGLRTEFRTRAGIAVAVNDVSFDVQRGEMVGVVGESGSGKSVVCLSILGLVPDPGRVAGGSVRLDGTELVGLPSRVMRRMLGKRIATILQDPMASLNPAYTVGEQVAEAIRLHRGLRGAALDQAVDEALERVRIPSARMRKREYPHAMSGGMRQRVVAAIAIACEPDLLIADEPTTALDVTTQAAFLKLLKSIQRERGLGAILVTHDLDVVRRACDRVMVMYGGRIVESGSVAEVLDAPSHPYTRALLASTPHIDVRVDRLPAIPGQPPALARLGADCAFRPRCAAAHERCAESPPFFAQATGHGARCWLGHG